MPPKWKHREAMLKILELAFVTMVGPLIVGLILQSSVRDEVDRMITFQQRIENTNTNRNQTQVQIINTVPAVVSEKVRESANRAAAELDRNSPAITGPMSLGAVDVFAASRFKKAEKQLRNDVQRAAAARVPQNPDLARQVGYVFQNPDHQIFADSVWQEATFAPRNFGILDAETEASIVDLLARCGLGDRHDDHPYRADS